MDTKYSNKQVRIENTLSELVQKLSNLESHYKSNNILFSEKLDQLNKYRSDLEI